MPTVQVSDFLPSTSAFHFGNAFEKAPVFTVDIPPFGEIPVGDASGGLCGGMVFAVRDYYEAGVPVPADTTAPGSRSKLFRFLADRLMASFDIPWGLTRYFEWMQFFDEDHLLFRGAPRRAVEDSWPAVKADLDAGVLCPLGLVTVKSMNPMALKENHQVLAYGYETSGNNVSIWVYDPNRPNNDYAALTLKTGKNPAIAYEGGPTVRGFFRTPYKWADVEGVG
jgi:hypothetical protein